LLDKTARGYRLKKRRLYAELGKISMRERGVAIQKQAELHEDIEQLESELEKIYKDRRQTKQH